MLCEIQVVWLQAAGGELCWIGRISVQTGMEWEYGMLCAERLTLCSVCCMLYVADVHLIYFHSALFPQEEVNLALLWSQRLKILSKLDMILLRRPLSEDSYFLYCIGWVIMAEKKHKSLLLLLLEMLIRNSGLPLLFHKVSECHSMLDIFYCC